MDETVIVCSCEEINKDEILGAIEKGAETFSDIKRLTRCGMGPCQSKNCFHLVAKLIEEHTNIPLKNFPPMRFRAPIQPMTVGTLSSPNSDVPLMSLLDEVEVEGNEGTNSDQ